MPGESPWRRLPGFFSIPVNVLALKNTVLVGAATVISCMMVGVFMAFFTHYFKTGFHDHPYPSLKFLCPSRRHHRHRLYPALFRNRYHQPVFKNPLFPGRGSVPVFRILVNHFCPHLYPICIFLYQHRHCHPLPGLFPHRIGPGTRGIQFPRV